MAGKIAEFNVDVIFEGALSKSWGMKDVLKAVADVPNVPFGALRISCPSKNIQGKVLIADAKHVVAASCSDDKDAYEALRTLLEVKDGNFAFLDLSAEDIADFDQSLFINIDRLIQAMPALPLSSSELFDENTLLDKVFGNDDAERSASPSQAKSNFQFPLPPGVRARKSSNPKISNSAPITQWNVLEPLFRSPHATRVENTNHAVAPEGNSNVSNGNSMIPDFVHTPDEQRSTISKLRQLPDSAAKASKIKATPGGSEPIKWLLAALGLSTMLICFAMPQVWNASKLANQTAQHTGFGN
ncbi:MAG: hypothetical protein K2X81_26325 [Candidatus Obscuribacterales bacterium]|nr:hypothetical protein [Candidatus Obscuribacterales bacterium]